MPSLNVLFWNVQKKDLTPQIVNLTKNREVDILVLTENHVSSVQIVKAISQHVTGYQPNHPTSQCEKVTIISRFSNAYIAPVLETTRLTVRRVQLPSCPAFLFTALHLVDKGSFSTESQTAEAYRTVIDLVQEEKRHQQEPMLIVGDFNMNPFDTGMISASGFHATMSSKLAMEDVRTIQGRVYPYFYNPMWSLIGDLNKEASGTYYYRKAEHVCYEWNMFDQVLLRPDLIPNFVKESLTIVDHDSVTSLLKENSRPNQYLYSDHLPLFFTLRF